MQPRAPYDQRPCFNEDFRSQLTELFRWRRDVRSFRPDPLPAAIVEALLATADLSPSVGLSQPWRFVIVDAPARRAAVRASFMDCNAEALAGQPCDRASHYACLKLSGLEDAPCQFAVFADPEPSQGGGLGRLTMPETTSYSAVMAVHTVWLAARSIGLGLGWVSILQPASVRAALDVPDHWTFIGYFCLGYPVVEDAMPELQNLGWEHRRPTGDSIVRR